MAKLVGISGLITGREFQIGELCVIGRSPNAHVRLPDLSVSRQHAKITRMDDRYIIEDLGSGRGTIVNSHYITVSHLRDNDEIVICGFRFRFFEPTQGRLKTADYAVVCSATDTQVISVDAAQFTIVQPLSKNEPETQTILQRRLNAILAVGHAASRFADTKALLDEILRACLEQFPSADRAMVAIPDRKRQSLVVQAMALRTEANEEKAFSLSRNVTSEVLYRGHSVLTRPGEMEPLVTDKESQNFKGSIMVAPLICHGQMIGLIYIDAKRQDSRFETDDLRVVAGMAAHIALALRSAQLRDSQLQQLRTEQELSAAHEVQKRFLPRGVPKLSGYSFVAHYNPCSDVGGDLYDFITLDDHRLGIVIGDVSGKGFPAALVMAWVASQLRVSALQERNPAAVLNQVNQNLLDAHQDDLFVTLIYGVIDRYEMSFCFCNAGHVPPFLRDGKSGRVMVLERGTGLPIGVVAGATYEEQTVSLEKDDVILMVTDGITEAMDKQRAMFGIEGLVATVGQSCPPVTKMVSDILSGLRSFVEEENQSDDITVVAIGVDEILEDVTITLPPGTQREDLF